MIQGAGGNRGLRVWFVAAIAAILCLGLASVAFANNLDRNTAQDVARLAAKRECRDTSGCTGYAAKNVRLQTYHRANGKIYVNSEKNGTKFQCRQQIVIKLNHDTGDITYFLSRRKCVDLGPA
jgi:V8-like Glu-specific endopeptidase